jgi:glutathione S-transferase
MKHPACDAAPLHLLRNEQAKSDYRRINAQGLVPALVRLGGPR